MSTTAAFVKPVPFRCRPILSVCDVPPSYTWHDSFIRVTRPIHACDTTRSHCVVFWVSPLLCTKVQNLDWIYQSTHTNIQTRTKSQHTTTHTHVCTRTRVPAHTQAHTLILSRVYSLVLSFALALYLTHSLSPSFLTPLARCLPYSLSLALSLHELGQGSGTLKPPKWPRQRVSKHTLMKTAPSLPAFVVSCCFLFL